MNEVKIVQIVESIENTRREEGDGVGRERDSMNGGESEKKGEEGLEFCETGENATT